MLRNRTNDGCHAHACMGMLGKLRLPVRTCPRKRGHGTRSLYPQIIPWQGTSIDVASSGGNRAVFCHIPGKCPSCRCVEWPFRRKCRAVDTRCRSLATPRWATVDRQGFRVVLLCLGYGKEATARQCLKDGNTEVARTSDSGSSRQHCPGCSQPTVIVPETILLEAACGIQGGGKQWFRCKRP